MRGLILAAFVLLADGPTPPQPAAAVRLTATIGTANPQSGNFNIDGNGYAAGNLYTGTLTNYNGGGAIQVFGYNADGASSVGTKVGSYLVWTNATSHLLEVWNGLPGGGGESLKLSVDLNGKLVFPTGGSAPVVGRAALTAGTVTISTAAVTASSVIQLTNCVPGGTGLGIISVGTIVAGTSFVINSLVAATLGVQTLDASTICWSLEN